jgi:hypothetical protein
MRVLGGMQSVNTLFTFYMQIVQFCHLMGQDSSVGIVTDYKLDSPMIKFRWG